MERLVARMIGTACLNARIYEEIEADRSSNAAAVAIVIVSSIAAAIGANALEARAVFGMLAGALLSWMAWVLLTLFIGAQLLPGPQTKVDFGEVLRTTGFSASVGILRVLGVVPVIGTALFAIVNIWMLAAFVIAIRQALDYSSTLRALAVCLLGWIIQGILFFGFVRTVI